MSRPSRSREIRAQRHAKELARWFGHGAPLPDGDEPDGEDERDFGIDPPVPDNRTPVGPTDCRAPQR